MAGAALPAGALSRLPAADAESIQSAYDIADCAQAVRSAALLRGSTPPPPPPDAASAQVEELVRNAVEAGATAVEVSLDLERFSFSVKDNGASLARFAAVAAQPGTRAGSGVVRGDMQLLGERGASSKRHSYAARPWRPASRAALAGRVSCIAASS
jgi:hypothetical protein